MLVLTKPFRSNYATDSASLVDKATQLLEAAKKVEDEEARGIHLKRDNPFKKQWGLQTDGDLWQQAWCAILVRGHQNQSIRWFKGHAEQDDIDNGTTTREDKKATIRVMATPTKE